MTTNRLCFPITIFEGPDGAGKSTAAKTYAEATGAVYMHFGPLPKVDKGLARIYVESMLPALLGYQPVVLDRCWLSEFPYGEVFRFGQDRLGTSTCRMLERLAMRCGAVVVKCLPSMDTCIENFRSRRAEEYLQGEEQLIRVWDLYERFMITSLPVVNLDFTTRNINKPKEFYDILDDVGMKRFPAHHTDLRTAGNLDARLLLVGEDFTQVGEHDSFYQWPFASVDHGGCSQWLTKQLEEAGIREQQLCWVNADALEALPTFAYPRLFEGKTVIGLGQKAHKILTGLEIDDLYLVEHPQYWKRFHSGEHYPLLSFLQTEVIRDAKL